MDSSRSLALLFSVIFIQICTLAHPLPEKLAQICTSEGDFSLNSSFGSNLENLFLSTISSTSIADRGFFNVSYGEGSDKVNGIGMCRGDLAAHSCSRCINDAINELVEFCPNKKEGIVWFDQCMLRYSNRSIFGKLEIEPLRSLVEIHSVHKGGASASNKFSKVLATLLKELKTQAVAGDSLRKAATGDANVTKSNTIYAMAQCTPDLSPEDCGHCLSNVTKSLSRCCSGRKAANVLTPSCNLRYEDHLFYGPLIDTITPTPSPVPPLADPPASLPPADPPASLPPADPPASPPPVDAPVLLPVDAPASPPADPPVSPPVDDMLPPPPPVDEPELPPEDDYGLPLPPYDASSPAESPLGQPDSAAGIGDMNSRFQALGTVVLLMILQYFV